MTTTPESCRKLIVCDTQQNLDRFLEHLNSSRNATGVVDLYAK